MGGAVVNVAIVLEGNIQDGGGFKQQISSIIQGLEQDACTFTIFVFNKENSNILNNLGIANYLVRSSVFDKLLRILLFSQWLSLVVANLKLKTNFVKQLDKNDIDIVYFLAPSNKSLELFKHNYIMTVWDLCHRDEPEFPEVREHGEFERRENLYNRTLKKAVAVIVDSKLGKQNIIRRYAVDANRVFVAYFSPAHNIKKSADNNIPARIKEKYQLPTPYIFYPAQLWAHKNHTYIIDALELLKKENIIVNAVFSGSDKGNLNYVLNYAQQKAVVKQIRYIGFVPDEDMSALYLQSIGLVMPSYFGPTNIPPLEALSLDKPVICSNCLGFVEQLADAALYCDLTQPASLAQKIKILLYEPQLVLDLKQRGKQRLKELEQYSTSVAVTAILKNYAIKLNSWKLTKRNKS